MTHNLQEKIRPLWRFSSDKVCGVVTVRHETRVYYRDGLYRTPRTKPADAARAHGQPGFWRVTEWKP